MRYIYADNAASTPVSEEAMRVFMAAMADVYGNPSSLHMAGQKALALLSEARENIAGCMNANPGEIFFTSGGSEADNQAILTAAHYGERAGKRHAVST